MSSTKDTVKKSSSKELQTVFWMPPLSSETSETLSAKVTPKHIREWLTLSQPDSLASHLVSLEKEPEKTTPVTCGLQPLDALTSYDHDMRSWRMLQACLVADISDEYLETWPKAGTMSDGVCYPQPKWERRIKEIGSGLLPSPDVNDGMRGPTKEYNPKAKSQSGRTLVTFAARVKMWPTPDNLRDQVSVEEGIRIWPTPRAADYKGATSKKSAEGAIRRMGHPTNLPEMVVAVKHNIWPTPTQCMHKGSSPKAMTRKTSKSRENDSLDFAAEQGTGALNPTWVEWLMGWPEYWTSLEPLCYNIIQKWRVLNEKQQWASRSTKKVSSNSMLSMWWEKDPSEASQRRQSVQQQENEYICAMPEMSCACAYSFRQLGEGEGKPGYMCGVWFDIPAQKNSKGEAMRETRMFERVGAQISRVEVGVKHRVDRLKAIGNGQVPQCMARAWELLVEK